MKMIQSSDIGKFGVRSVLSKIETIMLSLIHEKGLVIVPDKETDTNKKFEYEVSLI